MPSRRDGATLTLVVSERRRPYQAPSLAGGGQPVNTTPRRRRSGGTAVSAPVGLHLKPGQKGTKHLVEQYGGRVVCVRYRYDAIRRKRVKTVELVVAEADWKPRFAPEAVVALRVAFADVATRRRVKQAGGKWIPDRAVWELRYDRVVALGFRRRIVASRHPDQDVVRAGEKHPDADARPAST
jgi:hypothetical protein